MFKTSFSKYMTAFVIIIIFSFVMLSGIISFMLRSYAAREKISELEMSSVVVQSYIESRNVENLENYAFWGMLEMSIKPLVNRNADIDIFIADKNGKVLLKTVDSKDPNSSDVKETVVTGDLGTIAINDLFERKVNDNNQLFYVHRGDLGGLLDENCYVYAREIITESNSRGYVLSLAPVSGENALVTAIQNAVITSSVWVMLASVVALYFITERIVRPLKEMTNAARSFGEGRFDTRVIVRGRDEVSELGRAFNNMASSLENLEKMRNSFLASVSHDLRTPMTTIAGFIDGINSGAIPEEKREYYLGVISDEVHRLSRLVSQLLDVSRLESGDRKFNFEDFDVAELARIILISFEARIDEKRLNVEFVSPDDYVLVNADKDAIHQVIYNLCHNAIKFASDGARFKIEIKPNGSKETEITIYNEGQGISKEELPFVFDRFYKVDKSRGLDKSGVGLGLYICRTIIEAHGCSISVDSEVDKYCAFTFTLRSAESAGKRRQNKN